MKYIVWWKLKRRFQANNMGNENRKNITIGQAIIAHQSIFLHETKIYLLNVVNQSSDYVFSNKIYGLLISLLVSYTNHKY